MTATNHVLTGAVIAVIVPSAVVAVILSFLAHFVMDAIPHFRVDAKNDHERFEKKSFYRALFIDIGLATVALVVVPIWLHSIVSWWVVVSCMIACASPDLIWGWRLFLDRFRKVEKPKNLFSRFHTVIQWSETQPGIVIEIIWCVSALTFIFTRH